MYNLIRLRRYSKAPLDKGWADGTAPDADGEHGIGLVLGFQPDGKYLIVLDVDSCAGAKVVEREGVPPCPTILSRRGRKYIFKSRERVSHVRVGEGLEVLGERHQVCLPSMYSPDFRMWAQPGLGLNEVEPPPAPAWLMARIRAAMASVRPAAAIGGDGGSTMGGNALKAFTERLLPQADMESSNHAVLTGAAIVAHRMDNMRGRALRQALRAVFPGYDQRQVEHTARAVEKRKYGFSPRVFANRTGAALEEAQSMLSFCWRSRKRSSQRIAHGGLCAFLRAHGRDAGDGVLCRTTIKQISGALGISAHALRHRLRNRDGFLAPGLRVYSVTNQGRTGGTILFVPHRTLVTMGADICTRDKRTGDIRHLLYFDQDLSEKSPNLREKWRYIIKGGMGGEGVAGGRIRDGP